ncbi:claudin-25 [Podarcis muralis]
MLVESPNMAWHYSTIGQLGGLMISFFGWVSSCVTTSIPFWKNLNLELNELETWNTGLWHACVIQDENIMECKSYGSLLTLPLEFRISRIVMVLSNGLGFLALCTSILGLNCLKIREQNLGLKKRLGIAGGILFCISGMATLAPVSWVAYNVVREFWDKTVPEIVPRWEFGEALFLGWFAGFFLILGGFLLICSACFLQTQTKSKQFAVHRKPEVRKDPRLQSHHQYLPPKNADLVI